MKKLLQDSGVKDKNVFKHIDLVSKECETCQRLKKPPDRPVVGFPLATEFNEVVALDLKQLKSGIYVLHLTMLHATVLDASFATKEKKQLLIAFCANGYNGLVLPRSSCGTMVVNSSMMRLSSLQKDVTLLFWLLLQNHRGQTEYVKDTMPLLLQIFTRFVWILVAVLK